MDVKSHAVHIEPFDLKGWKIGFAAAAVAFGILAVWLFWGRALQLAIVLAAAATGFTMWRYPLIAASIAGFLTLSYVASYLPGSTTAFFSCAYLILLLRKLLSRDLTWRFGPFVIAMFLFFGWMYSTILWTDTAMPQDLKSIVRISLIVFAVSELMSSTRTHIAFFVGAAIGIIFSSVLVLKSLQQFYASGIADNIASSVQSIETSRFYGHWLDPNFMAMTTTAFLGGVIALWRSKIHWAIRILMFIAASSGIVAVLLSLSRTGFIGLAVIAVMMLAIERRKLLLISLFATIVVLLLTYIPVDLFGRISTLFQGGDNSSSERLNLLLSGWNLFWKNPFFGGGLGTFESDVLFLMPYLPHYFFSHNTFVDLAVDTGVVGVALFVACLVIAASGLNWKQWRIDPADTPAMLNAGLRASLAATIFSAATMSSATFAAFWVLFTTCAFYGAAVRRNKDVAVPAHA